MSVSITFTVTQLDEDITPMVTTPSISLTDGNISFDMQEKTYQGPITRSYAKQIQNQVNANLSIFSHYIDMAILPISSILIVLRCTGSENIIQDLTKQKNSKRGALDVVSLYVKPAQDISSPQGSNLWKEIKSTPISQSTKEAIGRKKTKSQSAKKSKK